MYKERIIFLVGARASGKTTVGKALATALDWHFVDTDRALQKQEHSTVAHMVECHGWEYFRRKEGECLRATATPHTVVGTGGGMVLAADNRHFMRTTGIVFYLCAPANLLVTRLAAHPSPAQRPSLTGRGLTDEVAEVLHQRDALYRETAHYVLDASLPTLDVAAAALTYLQE